MMRRALTTVAWAGLLACGQAAGQDSFGGATDSEPGSQRTPSQQQSTISPRQLPQEQPLQQNPQAEQIPQQQLPQSAQQPQQSFPPPHGPQQTNNPGPDFSRVTQMENQDFGVVASSSLHAGAMHGPTPTRIPGGAMITTQALWSTLQQDPRSIAIFDVLGGSEVIPDAFAAAPAAAPGDFSDQTQQQFGQFLQSVTGGDLQVPLLFYCQGPQCWMSYNAALRAINMGYIRVLWYRGGIEAWKLAGLPTYNPNAGRTGQR